MTSATEILRRLLDERGVEWRPIAWNHKKETFYYTSEGVGFCADEYVDGVKIYTDATITPAQAIDATLGRGTCQEVKIDRYWRGCGECGYIWEFMYGIGKCERPHYCPNCGREVVNDQ